MTIDKYAVLVFRVSSCPLIWEIREINNTYSFRYIYIYIYIYIYSCFSYFVCLWAWGGSNTGQNTSGRLTKILPTRQTHSEICFFEQATCQCPNVPDHVLRKPTSIAIHDDFDLDLHPYKYVMNLWSAVSGCVLVEMGRCNSHSVQTLHPSTMLKASFVVFRPRVPKPYFLAVALQNRSGTSSNASGLFFARICMLEMVKPVYNRSDPNI